MPSAGSTSIKQPLHWTPLAPKLHAFRVWNTSVRQRLRRPPRGVRGPSLLYSVHWKRLEARSGPGPRASVQHGVWVTERTTSAELQEKAAPEFTLQRMSVCLSGCGLAVAGHMVVSVDTKYQ